MTDAIPQKIVLMGFMGSGKSTIGKSLGRRMDVDFVDLDEYIEKVENRSIADIFAQDEESGFRQLESDYLKEVLHSPISMVLALGGGTPLSEENWKLIAPHMTVYLKMTPNKLFQRLQSEKEHRPLIAGLSDNGLKAFIKNTLTARKPWYERARITVLNNHIPNIISDRIATLLM